MEETNNPPRNNPLADTSLNSIIEGTSQFHLTFEKVPLGFHHYDKKGGEKEEKGTDLNGTYLAINPLIHKKKMKKGWPWSTVIVANTHH